MALNFIRRDEPQEMVDINTTPLIDVMLVLLIMLIITIPVQTHAVKLDLPNANTPPVATPPPVDEVDIDFDGTILWNNTVLPNRAALETQLAALAAAPQQAELHIRPDKLTDYKYVAEVLAEAQRLGVQKIGIVGYEQFAQ